MSNNRKLICTLLIIQFFFISCIKKKVVRKKLYKKAKIAASGLTLDQKIGQMVMVAIPGTFMNRRTKFIIKNYNPGGVILFGFNFNRRSNLKKLLKSIQAESMKYSKIPLYITIDQEGGRVKRIENSVTQFPGNMAAGIVNSETLTYKMAKIVGLQLKIIGINMNLAPVLDVNNNPDNPVINIRSFGSNTSIVSRMGSSYINGLQDADCIAVGKHFPGHGDTNKDSHITLPVINYDIKRLKKIEFPPFKRAIIEGVEGIMTAHIAFPEILNSFIPATISKKFLTDILRKEMKFNGLVFTDAIEMKGLTQKMEIGDAAVKSILAGADIVLLTSYGRNIGRVIRRIKRAVKKGTISIKRIDESVKRILELKLRYNIATFDKNKKIKLGNNIIKETDKKLLEEADNINIELSKKAIFYSGKKNLLTPVRDTVRIFITSNSTLRSTIDTDKNDFLFYNTREFFNKNFKTYKDKIKIVYYHSNLKNPNIRMMKLLAKICKKMNMNFVIVSSNNPFPIIRAKITESILISFSDTEESIRQLGFCLNGEFNPKIKSSFNLGL